VKNIRKFWEFDFYIWENYFGSLDFFRKNTFSRSGYFTFYEHLFLTQLLCDFLWKILLTFAL